MVHATCSACRGCFNAPGTPSGPGVNTTSSGAAHGRTRGRRRPNGQPLDSQSTCPFPPSHLPNNRPPHAPNTYTARASHPLYDTPYDTRPNHRARPHRSRGSAASGTSAGSACTCQGRGGAPLAAAPGPRRLLPRPLLPPPAAPCRKLPRPAAAPGCHVPRPTRGSVHVARRTRRTRTRTAPCGSCCSCA